MQKRILLFLVLCTIGTQTMAQTCDTSGYLAAYWYSGSPSSLTTKILPGNNGAPVIFGNLQVNYTLPSAKYVCYFTQLNSRGAALQTKTLGFEGNLFTYDACQSADNGYFISGFTNSLANSGADPMVAKLDGNGNPLWSFGLGITSGAFFKVAASPDGGCVVAGRLAEKNLLGSTGNILRAYTHGIVFKLDGKGTVQWGKEFYTQQQVEQVFQLLQMSDGSVVITGVKDNGPDSLPGSDFFTMRLEKNTGTTLWQKQSPVYFGQITETNNGNLLFRQGNYLYFVNSADGNAYAAKSFQLPAPYNNNYDLQYAGAFADRQDLYYDFVNKQNILLLKMYNYDSIAWVTMLPGNNGYGNANDPFSTIVPQNGTQGAIYVGGGLAAQGLATHDSTVYEENTFLYRAGFDGQTTCGHTLDIPVAFADMPPPQLANFKWYNTQALSFNNPRPLVLGAAIPVTGLACYQNFCCRDTSVSITDTLCFGRNITLPDGAVINRPGNYSVILKRQSGCDSVVFITVIMLSRVNPSLGNDTCFGSSGPIRLDATVPNVKSYVWQDGSTGATYSVSQAGLYWVKASNVCGTATDTVVVYPQCNLPVLVPSIFTPNGDGKNDVFRIADIKHQKLLGFNIYNRWGTQVFTSRNVLDGWDGIYNGQKAAAGAYVYLINYQDLNGSSKYSKGTFVLIR